MSHDALPTISRIARLWRGLAEPARNGNLSHGELWFHRCSERVDITK